MTGTQIEYEAGGEPLKGYLAIGGGDQPGPGVLVIHEWWGHNDYVRQRADQLAALGYTALAVDMYGHGKVADNPDAAGELMNGAFADPAALKARFDAAFARLAEEPSVDASKIAAVGYCFGGAVALEMARAGVDLAYVGSFHPGALATQNPATSAMRATVLVGLGADDPFVPDEDQAAFDAEMNAAGISCDFVRYPGVVHGYTVPAATERGETYGLPLRYDEAADKDSWDRLSAGLAAL